MVSSMSIKSSSLSVLSALLIVTGGVGFTLFSSVSPTASVQAQTAQKAEQFFRDMNGIRGISRYDRGAEYNGQCVTLVVRYLQDVYFGGDRRSRAYGHGKSVAQNLAKKHPNLFQFVTEGTPKRGAIISFSGGSYGTKYGHVGIVLETQGNSIKMMESNHDNRGTNSRVRIAWKEMDASVKGWADPIGALP
jgi:surface antigen